MLEEEIINDTNSIELIEVDDLNQQCTICMGEYNYIQNILCNCIYYYHIKCFFEWVHNSNKTQCIMCSQQVILNPLLNHKDLEFLNINLEPNIDNPLITLMPINTYKYNHSINKKRLELFIFNNSNINYLEINPMDLMILIYNNVDLPKKYVFSYSWSIKNNNKYYSITISNNIKHGIIYTIKDLHNRVQTNYINAFQCPGLILSQENKIRYEEKMENKLSEECHNQHIEANNDHVNQYRYEFIYNVDREENIVFYIFRRNISIILSFLLLFIVIIIIISFLSPTNRV